jgi:hypothetical protein
MRLARTLSSDAGIRRENGEAQRWEVVMATPQRRGGGKKAGREATPSALASGLKGGCAHC